MDRLDLSLDEARSKSKGDRPKAVKSQAPKIGSKQVQKQLQTTSSRPQSAGKGSGILSRIGGSSGTMVVFRNLKFEVTSRDIRELASTIGEISRGEVIMGHSGHSSGMAEVVFVNKGDAMNAVKRFNGVTLDGKPMDVTLGPGGNGSGGGGGKAAMFGSALGGGGGGGHQTFSVRLSDPAISKSRDGDRMKNGGGQDRGRVIKTSGFDSGRGGGGGGRDGGGKVKGKKAAPSKREQKAAAPSQADLDKQLEAFMAKK